MTNPQPGTESPRRRHALRLRGYDYSSNGAYFVTVCTLDRRPLLDDPIVSGIILDILQALPRRFPSVRLDQFVLMPNHVHLIIWLSTSSVEAASSEIANSPAEQFGALNCAPIRNWIVPEPASPNLAPSLWQVVGAFKSLAFKMYLDWIEKNSPGRQAKFWQRNYYEHVIRSAEELRAVREYIRLNPLNWALDRDNPDNSRRLAFPLTMADYLADIRPGTSAGKR